MPLTGSRIFSDMGRKRSYTPLNVFLNARLVGQLVREPSGGVSFAYGKKSMREVRNERR